MAHDAAAQTSVVRAAKRRSAPPELNVLIGLDHHRGIDLRAARLASSRGRQLPLQSRSGISIIILQVSIDRHHRGRVTQVIITGGIDLSSGSVAGHDRVHRHELRAGEHQCRARSIPASPTCRSSFQSRSASRWRPIAGLINGAADRLHEDSALHRHPRHDGDGARRRQLVHEGPASLVPDRRLRGDRPGPDAGHHLHGAWPSSSNPAQIHACTDAAPTPSAPTSRRRAFRASTSNIT